jgi:hypothetical protein
MGFDTMHEERLSLTYYKNRECFVINGKGVPHTKLPVFFYQCTTYEKSVLCFLRKTYCTLCTTHREKGWQGGGRAGKLRELARYKGTLHPQ